jgi:hypothetical protein
MNKLANSLLHREFMAATQEVNPRWAKSLFFASSVALNGNRLKIFFPPECGFHMALCGGAAKSGIERAILDGIGLVVKISVHVAAP